MFHARLDDLHGISARSSTPAEPVADSLGMRQLRHQTKNALQRIMAQVANSELRSTEAGSALADDVERRICLSARISDALFGLTAEPGPFNTRLTALCNATIALLAHPKQTISLDITVSGICPEALQGLIVQIAHEMVGNAVKHGMHVRLSGRIVVRLTCGSGDPADTGVTLLVNDDGWGPRKSTSGEGLPIMRLLAEPHGGTVSLSRQEDWTSARLYLPGGSLSSPC